MMQPQLFILKPPYLEKTLANGCETSFDRGSIVLIRPFADSMWSSIERVASRYVVAAPTASTILWLDLVSFNQRIRFATLSAHTCLSAIIGSATPGEQILRDQITDPDRLYVRALSWLRHLRRTNRETAWHYLALILQHAPNYTTLGQLITDLGYSDSKWQREFRRADLGTPGAWFQVIKVVRAALTMQRDPTASVQQIALSLGYYDAAALRHRLTEVIGSPSRDIRRCLGWTRMLTQALRRAGLSRYQPERRGTVAVRTDVSDTLQFSLL